MKFTASLKGSRSFRRMYAKGKSQAAGLLVIYCRRNGGPGNHLGLTVGTKVGKAVCRNRIRRRLREIYRLHEAEFRGGWDIVIVARTRAREAGYRELEEEFLRSAKRLGLLRP